MWCASNLCQSRILVVILALLVSGFQCQDSRKELADRIVSIVLERTGAAVCTGVLLDEMTALTANHCIENFELPQLRVRSKSGSTYRIERIYSHPTPSYLFPSGDILRVDLASPVLLPNKLPRLKYVSWGDLKKRSRMEVWGVGGGCEPHCPKTRSAYLLRTFDGIWLKALALVEAERETFCFADSGAPAFLKKDGKWLLVGLLSGKMDVLTGRDLSCANGKVLLSVVAPYAEWIADPHSFVQPQRSQSSSFAELCQDPFAESAPLIYSILLDLIERGQHLDQTDRLELLLHCKNAGQLFQKRLVENPHFRFDSPLRLVWVDGFEKIRSLSLPHHSEHNRMIMKRMPLLED